MAYRFAFGRPPAVAAETMVATSHPLATRAGLRLLERGGNAVDAALGAAAVLCVAEPMSTGIGGDAFGLVWKDGELKGLDAAGPAPATAAPVAPVAQTGPRSVTVPGALAGWATLSQRNGKLGLDACLADAIDAAERGVAATVRTAESWATFGGPDELGPTPRAGEIFRQPELGATLRAVAERGPSAFYFGEVARAICSVSWLEEQDLATFEARWVEPLRIGYRGHEIAELPPPTQGVAALEGLGLLERSSPSLSSQIASVRLALEDALANVRDGADVAHLLDPTYLDGRRRAQPLPVTGPAGGPAYACAVDGERTAASLIKSLIEPYG